MKENRRECRGRDGWLLRFQRSIKRRLIVLSFFGPLWRVSAFEGKTICLQLDDVVSKGNGLVEVVN
jgi:hypothetical protein